MKDQVTFRVRPEDKSKRYYAVRIFRTKDAMLEWARQHPVYSGSDRFSEFEAITSAYDRVLHRAKKTRPHPNIGHILFHAEYLGAGIVAHEMTHAAVYWADRHAHIDLGDLIESEKLDEKFAHAVGRMVSEFWQKYWRAKRKVRWL